jgi:hypothetical protein
MARGCPAYSSCQARRWTVAMDTTTASHLFFTPASRAPSPLSHPFVPCVVQIPLSPARSPQTLTKPAPRSVPQGRPAPQGRQKLACQPLEVIRSPDGHLFRMFSIFYNLSHIPTLHFCRHQVTPAIAPNLASFYLYHHTNKSIRPPRARIASHESRLTNIKFPATLSQNRTFVL